MNPSELILSPSRERLFRACKSPSKSIIYKSPSQNKTIIQSNKSPPKKETEELSHKEPEKSKIKLSKKYDLKTFIFVFILLIINILFYYVFS